MQASDWVNVFIVITTALTVWIGWLQLSAKKKITKDQNLKDSFDEFKKDFLENQKKFQDIIQDIEKIKNDNISSVSILKSSLENTTSMLVYRIELLHKEKNMLVEQFKKDILSSDENNKKLLIMFESLRDQITGKLDKLLQEHYSCIAGKNETTTN